MSVCGKFSATTILNITCSGIRPTTLM
jgi:hypothetical protein